MASEAGRRARDARPDRPRVFFALWPDADIAARLDALGAQAHAQCGGRRMRRDTLHLTLAFIGEVAPERVADLITVGDAVCAAPFTLSIDRLGAWRHNRIAWGGAQVAPEPLEVFVAELAAALSRAGFPTERRAFVPHVTLLRRIDSPIAACAVEPILWPARRVVLVRSLLDSAGARYEVLREWPVGDA